MWFVRGKGGLRFARVSGVAVSSWMAGPASHPDKPRTLKRVRSRQETVSQAARRLGLSRQTVHGWCAAAGVSARKADPVRNDQKRRDAKLRDIESDYRADPVFAMQIDALMSRLRPGLRQSKAEQRRVLDLHMGDVTRRKQTS